MYAEERHATCRLERESKCKSSQRRATKRTVAYRPAVSIRLSRSLGFSHMSIFSQSAERPHEWRPMASRKEQLFSLFFVARTTQPLHEKLFMGFRRANCTQRNTNCKNKIFLDNQLRGHHPRTLLKVGVLECKEPPKSTCHLAVDP